MIKKKNIIILSVLLIVLILATAALFMWDNSATDEIDFSSEDTIYIYTANADDFRKISVTLAEESFEFIKSQDDKWQIAGLEGANVKNYSISAMANRLAKLVAKSIVEENATSLEKYGLNNPNSKVSVVSDGIVKTFYAGDMTPLGDGYYFKDAEGSTVYTIYPDTYQSLFASKQSYRDIDFIKVDTSSVSKISIKKSGSEICINQLDTPVEMNGYSIADWEMTKPSHNILDDSRVSSLVTDKVSQMNVISIVSDKKDYAAYGLNNPYATVTLTDTNGTSQTIKISPSDDGNYYAIADGDSTIYLVGGEAMSFVDVKAFDIVSKFAHICSIDDVSEIVVTSKNEKYTMSISGSEEKAYKLNGKDIEKDIFSEQIYQKIIGLICIDFCSDASYAASDVTVEYTMNDSKKVKLEFVNYSDRNYAVFKNGTCTMQILKKEVNEMLDVLKKYSE